MSDSEKVMAYTFDRAGIFIAAIQADESPLEPGVYHLAANSTLDKPPEAGEGQIPRWNGTGWQLVTDRTPEQTDAERKLSEFLAQNPDVAELVNR